MIKKIHHIKQNLHLLHKYFFSKTPFSEPVQENDLGIVYLNFSLESFYKTLLSFSDCFNIETITAVLYKEKTYPIFQLTKESSNTKSPHLLILAGIHGNEQAALQGLLRILEDVRNQSNVYANITLTIIAPANPVGIDYKSRYNAQGRDINRDFIRFETPEARIVMDVIKKRTPDFVISLHEGPQEGGTYLYMNEFIPKKDVYPILSDLKKTGVILAKKDFFGIRLKTPGYQSFNFLLRSYFAFSTRVLKSQTLGVYLRNKKIPIITIETPWKNKDMNQRITPHLIVFQSVAKYLTHQ